jgi:dihydroneopterin aldolase
MKQADFAGVMIDTAGKGAGRLLDFMSPAEMAGFVARCRQHALICGLAGSLEAPDVPRLLAYDPDYLGFRGALCRANDRKAGLDAQAFAAIRELIPAIAEKPAADYSILSARGYSRDDMTDIPDRLHVRDLVLPVEIGAYASEHGKQQRVRFDVTAEVRRKSQQPEDLRHVFSYDLIIDAIKALVSSGHIVLVETLAERIARRLLQHADVLSINVRVEKLDLGPGAVGVEITRRRGGNGAPVAGSHATADAPAS